MKPVILAIGILFFFSVVTTAQVVRVRLDFPVGGAVHPSGSAPFRGAIWIGPEWQWQRGQYIYVPGRWVKPGRRGASWAPGRWKNTRGGFVWIPGRWR